MAMTLSRSSVSSESVCESVCESSSVKSVTGSYCRLPVPIFATNWISPGEAGLWLQCRDTVAFVSPGVLLSPVAFRSLPVWPSPMDIVLSFVGRGCPLLESRQIYSSGLQRLRGRNLLIRSSPKNNTWT